jgi:hypothetical protein
MPASLAYYFILTSQYVDIASTINAYQDIVRDIRDLYISIQTNITHSYVQFQDTAGAQFPAICLNK